MLVVCNGMERAGSTYQYNLTRLLIEASQLGEVHSYTGPNTTTWPLEDMRKWAADERTHLVKLHAVHEIIPEAIDTGTLRLVYIYRDLRDVAASLKRVRGLSGDKLVKRIHTVAEIYTILSELRERAPQYFVWHRYKDVRSAPEAALADIVNLLNVSPDQETIRTIVEACSVDAAKARCDVARGMMRAQFDALRQQDPKQAAQFLDAVQRGALVPQDNVYLLPYNHVSESKGSPGGWKKALTAEEAAAITSAHHDWFVETGYEL